MNVDHVVKAEISIQPTHSCFDDALEFLENTTRANLREKGKEYAARQTNRYRLVHAIVHPKDYDYAHAWVEEDGEFVWDAGIFDGGVKAYYQVSKPDYYERFRPHTITCYTLKQALELNLKHYHFGPWEEKYRKLCTAMKCSKCSKECLILTSETLEKSIYCDACAHLERL